MDAAEIETRTGLRHTPTLLYDSEALREREALETLSAKIYIVKDLTVRRLFNKRGWKGPHTSFDLSTEMGRAIRMGSPSSGHGNGRKKRRNTTPRISISKTVWRATARANHK